MGTALPTTLEALLPKLRRFVLRNVPLSALEIYMCKARLRLTRGFDRSVRPRPRPRVPANWEASWPPRNNRREQSSLLQDQATRGERATPMPAPKLGIGTKCEDHDGQALLAQQEWLCLYQSSLHCTAGSACKEEPGSDDDLVVFCDGLRTRFTSSGVWKMD